MIHHTGLFIVTYTIKLAGNENRAYVAAESVGDAIGMMAHGTIINKVERIGDVRYWND
jgi:hypothetical protein